MLILLNCIHCYSLFNRSRHLICFALPFLSSLSPCQLCECALWNAGQCRCKPNIEGRACDQCKLGYYNFMNPGGCEACNCDPEGSYAAYCNPISGQCPCKPNASGRRCEIPDSSTDNSISNQSPDLSSEGGSVNTATSDEITTQTSSSSLSPTPQVTGDEVATSDAPAETSASSEGKWLVVQSTRFNGDSFTRDYMLPWASSSCVKNHQTRLFIMIEYVHSPSTSLSPSLLLSSNKVQHSSLVWHCLSCIQL